MREAANCCAFSTQICGRVGNFAVMCGIAGYFSSTNHQERLRSAAAALRRRGPDAEGFYIDGAVGLAHRRLSVIDLSDAAGQPFHGADGAHVVVYNGELYNYRELAKEINHSPRTRSDTEILLEAYIKWGKAALNRFNGIFAFAVWDGKKLFLARDPMGVKPLVYAFDGRNLFFASEIKALLELVPRPEIRREALCDYMFLEYVPGPQTIFEGIYKLMPGAWLEVSDSGMETGTYYDVISRAEGGAFSEKTGRERFEAALARAVELQQVADVPLGAFLSGGTDSSLLAAMFQEKSSEPVRTFTIGFDVATHDESGYAEAVAQKLGTRHTLTRVSESESLAWAEKITDAYDEPFAVSSCIPMLLLSETTRRHVTVAFSGDGGDELFMGYGYYEWHRRIENLLKLGGRAGLSLARAVLSLGNDRHKNAAETLELPPGDSWWPRVWSRQQGMFSEAEISRLLGGNYVHRTVVEDWERLAGIKMHPYERISLFDVRRYLSEDLMYKADIASMHYGLEVRVPYLDVNVVESALSLPLNLRRDGATAKVLMKTLLEKRLPHELVHRKKWGFPAPTAVWLSGRLGPALDRYLDKNRLAKQGIFDPKAVLEYVRRFRAGEKRLHSRLWNLLVFQMWHEKYAKGKA